MDARKQWQFSPLGDHLFRDGFNHWSFSSIIFLPQYFTILYCLGNDSRFAQLAVVDVCSVDRFIWKAILRVNNYFVLI